MIPISSLEFAWNLAQVIVDRSIFSADAAAADSAMIAAATSTRRILILPVNRLSTFSQVPAARKSRAGRAASHGAHRPACPPFLEANGRAIFRLMSDALHSDIAKGERTRARILDEAIDLASVQGLGGLTIGPLAERLGLSKSGLFAHFQSKEALQVETLERVAEKFRAEVTEPVRAVEDRRARLRVFFARWIDWLDKSGLAGGCPILAAAIEFDDVPGPVHDTAARHFGELQRLIVKFARAAQPEGDAEALAAAVMGLAMSHLVRMRLLGDRRARAVTMRAFEGLLAS
jgi:AcrR family transcriptional regulator